MTSNKNRNRTKNKEIIDKDKLEFLILREIEESDFPLKTEVITQYYSEMHPESYNIEPSIYIQINVGNTEKNNRTVFESSYLDFYYNPKYKRIEHINMKLVDNLQGQGYGRQLIETMETIGRRLGCHTSRIYININGSFWNHMGYKYNGKQWDKKL